MKKERELIEKLKKLGEIPVQVFTAKVVSVSEDNDTVDVVDADGNELYDVRLKAAVNDSDDNVVMFPAVDSDVLVGLIGNSDQALFVVMATKTDKIRAKSGDTTIKIDTNGIVIDGGNNGPLFISQSLIDDVNGIKQDLNTLKNVFSGWTPATGDGGTALKTAATTWFGQPLQDTNIDDVTNERVKH